MSIVLITGGAGFVGLPTVRAFQRLGHDVTVLDSFSVAPRHRAATIQGLDARLVTTDIRDREATIASIVGVQPDIVVHLAALHFIPYCIANPAEALAVNVVGTQHVLDAVAAIGGVEVFTFASTADVYQPDLAPHHESGVIGSDNVYGQSKLIGEQLVAIAHRYGHIGRTVVTRFFNVIGPGETNAHLVPDILDYLGHGNDLALGATDTKRDYVFVEDVARVVSTLTTSQSPAQATMTLAASGQTFPPNITVNVGTGASYSAVDIVDCLATLTGRPLRICTDPDKVRRSDRPNLQADIATLQSLLPGFSPTPLAASLGAALDERGLRRDIAA